MKKEELIMKIKNKKSVAIIMIALVMILFIPISFAESGVTIPKVEFNIGNAESPEEVASSIQVIILLTVLSLAPSILVMTTCFTRFIIILSFVRKALALQTTPPNQVLIGLALFLTLFVMTPTFSAINEDAFQPFMNGEISQEEAFDKATYPLKDFMLRQTDAKDLALFVAISDVSDFESYHEIPITTIIPAFIIGEIKKGFQIGFLIFIPFIVIDMVVASTLMALGMMMLPPVMISLPFKILLFILVDGWNVIVEKMILSIK